jgi:hypothetical protein
LGNDEDTAPVDADNSPEHPSRAFEPYDDWSITGLLVGVEQTGD